MAVGRDPRVLPHDLVAVDEGGRAMQRSCFVGYARQFFCHSFVERARLLRASTHALCLAQEVWNQWAFEYRIRSIKVEQPGNILLRERPVPSSGHALDFSMRNLTVGWSIRDRRIHACISLHRDGDPVGRLAATSDGPPSTRRCPRCRCQSRRPALSRTHAAGGAHPDARRVAGVDHPRAARSHRRPGRRAGQLRPGHGGPRPGASRGGGGGDCRRSLPRPAARRADRGEGSVLDKGHSDRGRHGNPQGPWCAA